MTTNTKSKPAVLPEEETKEELKTCFIVMPISNADGYDPGHFNRVYEYIIKPACKAAGFTASRADDTKHTNTIILDILNQIVKADMVICDLSSKNPNVMYELGIRQAFNLPVVLIKDIATNRVFDTSALRDVEYDQNLRIDTVRIAVENITEALKETYKRKDSDTHSLISLLNIEAAKLPERKEISPDTALILDAIKSMNRSEDVSKKLNWGRHPLEKKIIEESMNAAKLERGFEQLFENKKVFIFHKRFGEGEVVHFESQHRIITVNFYAADDIRKIEYPYSGVEIEEITI